MKDVKVKYVDVFIVFRNENEPIKGIMKKSKTVVDKSVVKKAKAIDKRTKIKSLCKTVNKKIITNGNKKTPIKNVKKAKNPFNVRRKWFREKKTYCWDIAI